MIKNSIPYTTGNQKKPIEKDGYRLIFSDDFDEKTLDTEKWLPRYFPHATDYPIGCITNYTIANSCLNLTIDQDTPPYTRGSSMKVSSVQTYEKNLLHPGAGTRNITPVETFDGFTIRYGYFELRAKLPDCGGGGHVAWWMIGTQDDAHGGTNVSEQTGEIDIIEPLLARPNVFTPKIHSWTDKKLNEFSSEVPLQGTYDDSYHIYAMNWTPDGITFFVDGEELAKTCCSPDYRMCMFLGIYTYSDQAWSGQDNGVYPKTFSIDYIRVYQDINGYSR